MPYVYDNDFLEYTETSSRYAAAKCVEQLRAGFAVGSVLDVGCARGTWLDAWRAAGVEDVIGVDGDYVERDSLRIPPDRFRAADLAQPFALDRRFDLVQSLEVAEHVPAAAAETFVDNLVAHSRGIVLFSAAPPGQGGEFHVNEQPYEYWRGRFAARGFAPYDCVRPWLAHDKGVSFWYRFNPLLYVDRIAAQRIPAGIAATRVPDGAPIRDVSPLWFRARKSLVRALPFAIQQTLARFKARHWNRL